VVARSYHPNPTYTRIFREHTPESELFWKKDFDRTVQIIECTGWKIQSDEYSRPLKPGDIIKIPANKYHKIIKGTGSFVVEITPNEQQSHT
jgi:quercetin dioxygenase-like cupin family protein